MVVIEINANKGKLNGPLKVLVRLYEDFRVKHPQAFYMRIRSKGRWDGYINYISKSGLFDIGLLPLIAEKLDNMGQKWRIEDNRPYSEIKPKIPKYVGSNKIRPYQKDILESILYNKVGKTPFRVGVVNAATNAGKTTIMVAIHKAFKSKLTTLIITNDSDWFNQAKDELPELLDGEDIAFIQGSKTRHEWKKINIAMVQTLSRNISLFERELAKVDICLIDECDLSDNKMYKDVITRLYNTTVRVGLTGTIFMSPLKKDIIKNMNMRSFLGNELHVVTKEWMQKKGYSTKVIVRVVYGNTRMPLPGSSGNYDEVYRQLITDNEQRHSNSFKRVMKNIKRGRYPCLVVCQYIDHVENLYKYYKSKLDEQGSNLVIRCCHHKTKDRSKLIKQFREGKIDILISSFIIRRGKNFPLLRYLQNASATDSEESVSQLMGRLERKHKDKKFSYMEDLYDIGDKYLLRHSNHRVKFYKNEKVRLIIKVKRKITL